MPYVQTLTMCDEVRVDMMLGIALALPDHHIPPVLSLGGLAARHTTSSSSSRVDVLQVRSTRDSLRFVDRGASLRRPGGDTATGAVPAVSPTTEPGHSVPCWLGIAALVGRSGGIAAFCLNPTLAFAPNHTVYVSRRSHALRTHAPRTDGTPAIKGKWSRCTSLGDLVTSYIWLYGAMVLGYIEVRTYLIQAPYTRTGYSADAPTCKPRAARRSI